MRSWGEGSYEVFMVAAVVSGAKDKGGEGHKQVFNRESEGRALESKLGDGAGCGGVPWRKGQLFIQQFGEGSMAIA